MTAKEKRKKIDYLLNHGEKTYCQGCGKRIYPYDDMTDVEYVRTKRHTQIFFHTRCLNEESGLYNGCMESLRLPEVAKIMLNEIKYRKVDSYDEQ